MSLTIGLLGFQGAIEEHKEAIIASGKSLSLPVKTKDVLLPEDLENLDGIILPGGESTAMIKQGNRSGLLPELLLHLENGLPTFGTCAGAILMAKEIQHSPSSEIAIGALPILDLKVVRNGYGSQRESFSTNLEIKNFLPQFTGIFIRAPLISNVNSKKIRILASFRENPVFVEQENIMASTFHPELAKDTRIHQYFLKKCS